MNTLIDIARKAPSQLGAGFEQAAKKELTQIQHQAELVGGLKGLVTGAAIGAVAGALATESDKRGWNA